jgi:hypothetical protein
VEKMWRTCGKDVENLWKRCGKLTNRGDTKVTLARVIEMKVLCRENL